MKAVVAAFNQTRAFSVITNLRMELFEALMDMELLTHAGVDDVSPHGSFEEAGAAVAAEHAVVLP